MKVEGGSTTKFIYDGAKVVLERDGDDETQVRYTHEGGSLYSDLLSQRRDGASYDYLLDGLASVKQIVDSSEAVENSYSYEAFGQPTVGQSDVANPYLFVGGYGVRWESMPQLYHSQGGQFYSAANGLTIDWLRYGHTQIVGLMPLWRELCMVQAVAAREWTLLVLEHCPLVPAGYGNAFQHCMWTCEIARRAGPDCALWAAFWHEPQAVVTGVLLRDPRYGPWVKGWWADTLHDLHNNIPGIEYRHCGNSCFLSCMCAYRDGRLAPDPEVEDYP